MKGRAMQALYLLALDPVAETKADENSYGFRERCSCADAIEGRFTALARHPGLFRQHQSCVADDSRPHGPGQLR
jgi:RNA-directed DNA polymerase